MASRTVAEYLQTFNGRELLKKYPGLDETGTWCIRGEDPNCDFGGRHYQPILGYVVGKLSDVVEEAVKLPSFWTWGGGGEFTFINVRTLEDLRKNDELIAEKKRLEAALAEINKKLVK